MDARAKADFGKAMNAATTPAVIHTAFDLPSAQQASLKKTVDEAFGTKCSIKFATSPDLVSGIELAAGGQKIAWSIADYLAAMEQGVDALVKADGVHAGDKPKAASPPKHRQKAASKPKAAPKTTPAHA
jgi:F-type H+-transporting ATPase subunit b